jgi:hypothetical protein
MEMTDLTASQRLLIAKLRRPLSTPFGTVGQPVSRGVLAIGRPAAPDSARPPRQLRPERIAMRGSCLTWRTIGYRLRSFHFPSDP